MTYGHYVIAAYAVFAFVLGVDFIATRLQITRQLRSARLRMARESGRTRPPRLPESP
ncbi:MAG: heme exporter protein CcmD [Lysobacter sp.]|nr:MAG: heme exporter protein CcmD [Lysobacter sp.]